MIDDPTKPTPNRGQLVLGAVGAWIASLYWAFLTLLIGVAAAADSVSVVQMILPIILIVLYALRGFQLLRGDPTAARSLLWLHGIGGVMAILQVASGDVVVMVLQGIKLLVHVFGGITAFVAHRALTPKS